MTSSERHAQVKKIFLELCELSPEDRSDRLEEICAGDHRLRSEVEQLLAFDERGDRSDSGLDPVTFVGPYRLLQKIGEGGMGEVWEAEQQQPIRRRVALKLIKWGMDTKEVLARFESERQALALMNHPNIAKAFDAGSSDEGRPYFAMEFVKGVRDQDLLRCQSPRHPESIGALLSGLRGCAARPPEGRHPPRPQTVQYPGRRRGRPAGAQDHRFRGGQGHLAAPHRKNAVHRARPVDRDSRVHEPGAGRVDEPRRRYPVRCLLVGRGPLRAVGGRATVRLGGTANGRVR